jgi:hypothetical protein
MFIVRSSKMYYSTIRCIKFSLFLYLQQIQVLTPKTLKGSTANRWSSCVNARSSGEKVKKERAELYVVCPWFNGRLFSDN